MPTYPDTILLHAGPHARNYCPITVTIPAAYDLGPGPYCLLDTSGGVLLAQCGPQNTLSFCAMGLVDGTTQVLTLKPLEDLASQPIPTRKIDVVHQETGALAIWQEDRLITRYVYSDVPARPYFFPVNSPNGVGLTRAYPMRTDVAGETADHPHHRSLWIAYGEVNGVDNWSEEAGHGFTEHQSVDSIETGPVCGGFAATGLWTDREDTPILTERLQVRVWAAAKDVQLMDFTIELAATHGAVHFGDTKEGGMLSIRVATPLDVRNGGHIANAYGGIDESECWGQAAHWCSYRGEIDGNAVGIAVLDHPTSFRSPSHWHVRNYGLMTANPFGYAAYTNGVKNGSLDLADGASIRFHYRVVLQDGETAEFKARYLDFAFPPRVEIAK